MVLEGLAFLLESIYSVVVNLLEILKMYVFTSEIFYLLFSLIYKSFLFSKLVGHEFMFFKEFLLVGIKSVVFIIDFSDKLVKKLLALLISFYFF